MVKKMIYILTLIFIFFKLYLKKRFKLNFMNLLDYTYTLSALIHLSGIFYTHATCDIWSVQKINLKMETNKCIVLTTLVTRNL